MSDDAKWYVVHTYSGYENKVASNLRKTVESRNIENLITDIKIPTENVVEIKDGKEKEVERKIFPGYVLVKMILNDYSWYIVRNIRGCAGFVGSSTKPIPLTSEEVKKLGVESKKIIQVPYAVGDSVRIIEGSLANTVGRVTEINAEARTAKVIVSMFGRETPAEVSLSNLESL